MSGTYAIHGIILVGALLIAAGASSPVTVILGFMAVVLATTNVVGGFVVTDRMLEMFKGRQAAAKTPEAAKTRCAPYMRWHISAQRSCASSASRRSARRGHL